MPEPADKQTIKLESRGSTELAISQLIRNGQLEILPDVESKGLLFLQFRKGRVTLTAGKYVGLIPLTPSISVEVRPKMPIANLARVLDRSRISLGKIDGVGRIYREQADPSASVMEFLLENLIDATKPVRKFGLLKQYVRKAEASASPRGRILLSSTAQLCYSKGIKHKVIAERFDQTSNIAANRLIRAAFVFLLTALKPGRAGRRLIADANAALLSMPDEIGPLQANDLNVCRHILDKRNLPEAREYYYRPLEVSSLVLSGLNVSLDRDGEDIILNSYIVDFESVFETYIRRVLEANAPEDMIVKDGNAGGQRPLYDDRKEPPAQPDIVVREKGAGCQLVLEVKYKARPDRQDINQAVTYALVYRTRKVILVHQSVSLSTRGFQHLGSVNGIAVESYGIDMAALDMSAEEQKFSGRMFGMLRQEALHEAALF